MDSRRDPKFVCEKDRRFRRSQLGMLFVMLVIVQLRTSVGRNIKIDVVRGSNVIVNDFRSEVLTRREVD